MSKDEYLDDIFDEIGDITEAAKSDIITRYRSVEDIKKAVGELEIKMPREKFHSLPNDEKERIFTRDVVRKGILKALDIEEDKDA